MAAERLSNQGTVTCPRELSSMNVDPDGILVMLILIPLFLLLVFFHDLGNGRFSQIIQHVNDSANWVLLACIVMQWLMHGGTSTDSRTAFSQAFQSPSIDRSRFKFIIAPSSPIYVVVMSSIGHVTHDMPVDTCLSRCHPRLAVESFTKGNSRIRVCRRFPQAPPGLEMVERSYWGCVHGYCMILQLIY
ncbi:uncharacterized protein BO95DRAFT_73558 [Aspergillus brunneoviolaceus CBS 621.78]|uniref:Uncharacterized protein n=1 Tax=Aspergillus brunneoviolaceus CBS 621.78 TaxID=1450534 RepID=A0ACD1GEI7_9EURO|nr:hypothetical protein BO95DRAFT_73558 [Aspergillus brunneoviolaceus CBS 621.78]RAH47730.1 hypothetical protein BO95DRAFT_73558 [Aspergillus brunneoviolaceus CBS 621.78]